MDIENFSKTEIVLTAFLVSFVTAILVGVVIILLSEDTPRDIIRVTERIISDESTASSSATTSPEGENKSSVNRDAILDQAVRAVARVTDNESPPQAGVLIKLSDAAVIVTNESNLSTGSQALFEDGTVVKLQKNESPIDGFTLLSVTESSGSIHPLSITATPPNVGDLAFAVPFSERPEIIPVSVRSTSEQNITTTAGDFSTGGLLLNTIGKIIGVYDMNSQQFRIINQL